MRHSEERSDEESRFLSVESSPVRDSSLPSVAQNDDA